jgi:O-acetyl-ADP-ribose deacetylase (regulator of RNase III)
VRRLATFHSLIFIFEVDMKIYLKDMDMTLATRLKAAFSGCEDVEVSHGNILTTPAKAIVSPANSFGFMDGGIDKAYTKYFGIQLQNRLQNDIHEKWYGEIPVGQAYIIPTFHDTYKYLICAPTMRVPEEVRSTVNSYLAFRAVLLAVLDWNKEHPDDAIDSIISPGLGTLTGRIPRGSCALQMRRAYDIVIGGRVKQFHALWDAKMDHDDLRYLNPDFSDTTYSEEWSI